MPFCFIFMFASEDIRIYSLTFAYTLSRYKGELADHYMKHTNEYSREIFELACR